MSSQKPETQQQAQTPDSESSDSDNVQVGLTDLSYEGHTVPEPPADRVSMETVEHDEFFQCSIGDVLWVDDTEYVVVDRPMRLIAPSPLLVVGEDGEQGELIAGELPNGTADGVTWVSNISDKENHEISREDLVCSYDRVYKLEEESLEHIHQWAPDTDHRECPACNKERDGDPLRIEQQASKTVELRRCVNTDCKYVYRFVREFPDGEPATLVTNEYESDSFKVETIDGVFRCEEQDDFKFPVETNKGRDDGFYTAREIAEFLNPKMTTPETAELFESEEDVSPGAVIDSVDFVTETSKLYGDEEYRQVKSLGELYEDYVSDRLIPVTDEVTDAVEDASSEAFFRALMFLRRVIPDKPAYHEDEPEPTGFDIDAEDAVDLVTTVLQTGSVPDDVSVPENVENELRSAFETELTGDDVVAHSVFKELLEDHTSGKIFGVVDVSTNRSGELTVTWKDHGGWDKMMRITFTRMEGPRMDTRSFRWNLQRHDLSMVLP